MITIYYRNLRDKKLQIIDKYRLGSWVYVEEPTEADIDTLVKEFKLDPSLLHDATDPYEVPRMELEEDHIYIFSRYPVRIDNQVTTYPILFIFTDQHFFSITNEKFQLAQNFINKNIFFTTQKTKLFLQLFSLINSAYNTHLHTISRLTRSTSRQLEKISNKDIAQSVGYERVLNDFHLALVRTNAVLNNLLSEKYLRLYEEDRDLVEDLFLSNDQLIQLTKENLRSIVNIRDAYSTIMTHNTNRVIRFFTSVTVLLTIPTIIASVYGMNVPLPYSDSQYAFLGIMLLTTIILVSLILMFIQRDWL